MKKIFIIDEHLSSLQNGVGTYQKQLINCLVHKGYSVVFLSFNEERRYLHAHLSGAIQRIEIPFSHNGEFIKMGPLIFPLLSIYFEDSVENVFVVSHSPCVQFLKSIRQSYPQSKIIFTIHDQGWTAPLLGNASHFRNIMAKKAPKGIDKSTLKFVKEYSKSEYAMYKLVDAIVCLSNSTYELLQDTYAVSSDKLHYIPNAIPSMSPKEKANVIDHKGDLKEELGILPNERIVLYVGRQAKTKGIYELLQAFEQICHDNLQIRLVIVGEIRDFSELVRFIPKSVAHIIYTGLIDAEQLRKWYTVADIGILPTYTEQCSYVGLEMMKYIGVVVTTDAWGVKDMFQDGINAIVAPLTYDSCTFVENLKNAIKRGLTLREKERKILETNCLQTLKDKYNTVSMQNSYEQLISSLS